MSGAQETLTDALGNIAAMGYSDDPKVAANIARLAVEMARKARRDYFASRAAPAAPAMTDEALDHGHGGTIGTDRNAVVRYWVGYETGDVFGCDCDYDGLTLTVEVADAADARAMLDAMSCPATQAADACPCCGGSGQYGDACVRAINGAAPAAADLLSENERLRNELAIIALSADDDDGWTSDGHERCTERAAAALSTPGLDEGR